MENLPRTAKELEKIFKEASTPEIAEFSGEYYVDMLTGLPSLKGVSHRKTFRNDNGKVLGHNLLFSSFVWGRFSLEEGTCQEIDSSKVVVINYFQPGNTFISKGIRDQVKCIEKGSLYLGRLNCLLNGNLRFLGYFSLSKL